MELKVISFFQIVMPIGEGGFGDVYLVKSTEDDQLYALKTERLDAKRKTLDFEVNILKKLQQSDRFPKYLIDGTESDLRFLVMELFGPNLAILAKKMPEQYFKLKYLPKLCDDMLYCIEDFHNRGFIHRDIKPQNFVVRPDGKCPICLIDYGISKLYIDKATGKHLDARDHVAQMGSPLFSSPNMHDRVELSRRDDLFSLLYSILFISETGLPWGGKDTIDQMSEKKHLFPLPILMIALGDVFVEIGRHVESLGYSDTPNYAYMHELLQKASDSTSEAPYEWMSMSPSDPIRMPTEPPRFDPNGFILEMCPYFQPNAPDSCLLI